MAVSEVELVDVIERSSLDLADRLWRESGSVYPPTVHLLSKHADPSYLGSVATRPFYRGADAAHAVTMLGLLPSVVSATRLVVVWEHTDLAAALESPEALDGELPNGLVVVDALVSSHVVRWHGVGFRVGLAGEDMLIPEWRTVVEHPGGRLPEPVADLLELWRQWRRGDESQVVAELRSAGFTVTWTAGAA